MIQFQPPTHPQTATTSASETVNRIFFFAPIAEWPPKHGGSIRTVRLFEEFCRAFSASGFLIGSNFNYQIEAGHPTITELNASERSKTAAALSSLLQTDHYLKQKQLTTEIRKRFEETVAEFKPDVLFMSYLYSSVLINCAPNGVPVFIDTHNNDWEWFGNFKRCTRNPFVARVCDNSLQKTNDFLEALPARTTLMHVSEEDAEAYQQHRNDLTHLVVPNGCDVKPRNKQPDYDDPLSAILFVGSLSSQMNVDALKYFAEKFWPELKADARFTVLGSNPGAEVRHLCEDHGWRLLANADDATLDRAYEEANFAILPFAYGAGSKLKLAEACGRGVPVLSTSAGAKGVTNLPPSVIVSDDPETWSEAVLTFVLEPPVLSEAIAFSEKHSWRHIANKFAETLTNRPDLILNDSGDEDVASLQSPLRILIHDFGGYPFIIQASRQLAQLGHPTQHHFVSLTGTDRDHLERFEDKEAGLTVHRHRLSSDYATVKYSLIKRFRREYAYGKYIAREIKASNVDVVISANAPSHIQAQIARAANDIGAAFIPWIQDFYSLAVADHLKAKIPLAGGLLGRLYMGWEKSVLKSCDRIAVISDDFNPLLGEWGLEPNKLRTIENWASVSEIPVLPKINAWSKAHSLDDKFCFLYSGTMGLKHNPDILVELAKSFRNEPDVRIVVVGEGLGIDYLKQHSLENLVCLPFQCESDYAQVLATADVLTALLEPGASQFSVPSKVLSYLCAARPILLAVPADNLAARIVAGTESGRVADPRDAEAFLLAAHELFQERHNLQIYAQNGRRYAEEHFRPEVIGRKFGDLVRS